MVNLISLRIVELNNSVRKSHKIQYSARTLDRGGNCELMLRNDNSSCIGLTELFLGAGLSCSKLALYGPINIVLRILEYAVRPSNLG